MMVLLAWTTVLVWGEQPADSLQQAEPKNQIDVDLDLLGHGEMRFGGLGNTANEDGTYDDRAQFLMGRTRLSIGYKRPYIAAKVTARHQGVWGQNGGGSFNLYEAWVQLTAKMGLFAKMGRQVLSYDDERIIGSNDWAMASLSHDVIKLGYEGYGHKVHAILGFNQNAENVSGGTYYVNGSQPYKVMHTLWYHFDVPHTQLGLSLLFMNIGMQGGEKDGVGDNEPRNRYQQLVGGYLSYNFWKLSTEASCYHQLGRNEHNVKIDAWMASVKAKLQLDRHWGFHTGFDYLSGDDYFSVRDKGMMGLAQHKSIKYFNPVYGSHHKFYGMMDFFYVQNFTDGFSPGLQNLYAGVAYSPFHKLKLSATYHYLAMATKLEGLNMSLGHDIDFEASYQILKDVNLSLGFSYMKSNDTMEKLKRADKNTDLKWAWFSLYVSPRIISKKW